MHDAGDKKRICFTELVDVNGSLIVYGHFEMAGISIDSDFGNRHEESKIDNRNKMPYMNLKKGLT